jgi:hypothetical protein
MAPLLRCAIEEIADWHAGSRGHSEYRECPPRICVPRGFGAVVPARVSQATRPLPLARRQPLVQDLQKLFGRLGEIGDSWDSLRY